MASDTGWHSGRDTPEEPAAETVTGHQGPRFEIGDTPAQRVEERPV